MPLLVIPLNDAGIQFLLRCYALIAKLIGVALVERHMRYTTNVVRRCVQQACPSVSVLLHLSRVSLAGCTLRTTHDLVVPQPSLCEEFRIGLGDDNLPIDVRTEGCDKLTQRLAHSERTVLLFSRTSDLTEGVTLLVQSSDVRGVEAGRNHTTDTARLSLDGAHRRTTDTTRRRHLMVARCTGAIIAVCNLDQRCTLLLRGHACGQSVHNRRKLSRVRYDRQVIQIARFLAAVLLEEL